MSHLPLPRLAAHGLSVLLAAAALLAACSDSPNECPTCQREKCADLLAVCDPDPGCACMASCVAQERLPGVQGCLESCGLTERPASWVPVETCMAASCPDAEDECARPEGYTPPEPVEPVIDTVIRGGGQLPDCGFDRTLPFDPLGTVLQLESGDGQVCVRLERREEGAGSLANVSYTLLEMSVGPLGEVALVDDPAALCWYASHHNFLDVAHAWTGSTHHDLEVVEDGHGAPRRYLLRTFEQGPLEAPACSPVSEGTGPLGAAVELLPVGP